MLAELPDVLTTDISMFLLYDTVVKVPLFSGLAWFRACISEGNGGGSLPPRGRIFILLWRPRVIRCISCNKEALFRNCEKGTENSTSALGGGSGEEREVMFTKPPERRGIRFLRGRIIFMLLYDAVACDGNESVEARSTTQRDRTRRSEGGKGK